MKAFVMTDKQREFLRANLYIVAGFLGGLGAGIAISAAIGRTVLKLRVPQFLPGNDRVNIVFGRVDTYGLST